VIPIYLILLVLGISLYATTQLHYNLSLAHVSDVIYQNYLMGIEGSDTKTLEYFYFDGSWLGFLINLPLAAAFGLFRPLIFEASNFFQALVGLENFAVLLLFILGIWKSGMKIKWKDPIFLVAVFYIVFLNVMLAFSTPNFGTLSRYKVGYWPFFVLLVLILNKKDKIKVKFSNLQD
jgi:hypothetical protein